MVAFREWLLLEEFNLVDPSVLNSYEQAFQQRLELLIQRTKNPELKKTFEDMRHCPIKDRNGRCSRFIDYIVGALVKHGCHHQYDLEGSLQRIIFRMLGTKGERGLPHKGLFDFDESRPFNVKLGNPLEVMFKKYLANDIRNIGMGCFPSLRMVQHPGRFTIGQGGDPGTVSPDEISDRPERDDPEMIHDLTVRLKKKSTPDLNLVDLFQSIMNGERLQVRKARFGSAQATLGRKIIIQTIEQFAQDTQNWGMLRLLDRFKGQPAKRGRVAQTA